MLAGGEKAASSLLQGFLKHSKPLFLRAVGLRGAKKQSLPLGSGHLSTNASNFKAAGKP